MRGCFTFGAVRSTAGKTPWSRSATVLGLLLLVQVCGMAIAPTTAWLQHYSLQPWETVLDHDQDGFIGDEEFAYGTDPFDPMSQPPRFIPAPDRMSIQIPLVAGVAYGNAVLETSVDLMTWTAVSNFPPSEPGTFVLPVDPQEAARFFRFAMAGLANSDSDCLLDFEEVQLFHTDPLSADTDGDGLSDCDEVTIYRTNPVQGSTVGRGAVRGRVVLEEDKDPKTRDHPGLAGWVVFVDLDHNGERDANEPRGVTDAAGDYLIPELDPGLYRVSLEQKAVWVQVFPELTPVPTPDGYPDRVVEVFDSGTGPIPFPYGRYPDPLPGLRLVFPSPPPDPIDASVVLGALPAPPIAGPYGGWAHVDMLVFPSNSFVTVAFDGEEIIDGPGPDLAIWCAAATTEDSAEISLGSTADNLVSAGIYTQAETILIDLADVAVPQPVRYLKLRGLGLTGTYPGIDVVGFEALHYRPQARGHYDVAVIGGQTVEGADFGVAGNDRPPKIAISMDRWDVRAGESLTAQVIATDDLGIKSVQLAVNGISIPLNAENKGVVPVTSGGLLSLAATATDTANQESSTFTALIARNEDGTLPDLSGLTTGGAAAAGPSVQVISPVAGEILTDSRMVVGTILGTAHGVATWQLHYAPADAVNPEVLDAPDPDYVLLGEGTGPVIQAQLGVLAGDTLAAGAYLLRVSAADQQGTTSFLGFVVGVRVDPLDIRPAIVITGPTNEALVTYLTDVHGSITTRQELREWLVEYAPLSEVNLQNLADNTPGWTQIARGTNMVVDGVLAQFDPTLLPNDSYALRVSAWNKNGLGWAESLVVEVTGNAKLGNFAMEFTDLELPLAGIPITIKRVYDSLRSKQSGDFGYGWSLALQDADIAETVPQTGSGFISVPFRVGTRVYLTAPDGQRVGFTFQPEMGASSFLGAVYRAVFVPDPGVRYTLKVPEGDSAFLNVNSAGEVTLFFIQLPWNPETYVLQDTQGTRYTYDQAQGLLEIEDSHKNRVTFSPDAVSHSAGPQVQLTRDALGRITQIRAPEGQTWRYEYDGQGDLVRVVYPENLTATFGYGSARPHFLESIHDPLRGPSQRTEYDEAGRVAAVVDAAGNRMEQSWEAEGYTGTFTDARGHVTRITYDTRGNVVREEDPLGGARKWEYQNSLYPDLPTAFTDARSNRATYLYDDSGNLVRQDRPAARTSFVYDAEGRVTQLTHGVGASEKFTYDSEGNLVGIQSELGDLELTYTAHGLLASVLDGEGGLTRLEYDTGLQAPSRIVLPDGSVKAFEYDSVGRILRYIDPLGSSTRYEYDALGRVIRETDPAGAETRFAYDPVFPEKHAAVTDRAGRVTRYAYDELGRLVQETAPDGAITRYEYDPDGNRTAVTDPLNNRFEFRYDALNRLIEEMDPLGRKRVHTYDASGNRVTTIDRNGRERHFTYDAHDRLEQERWLDLQNGMVIRTITNSYNRNDELTRTADMDAQINLGRMYIPGGPLLSEEARYAGAPVRRLAFTYDAAVRREVLSVTTISPVLEPAVSIGYTRDLAGRLRILSSRNPLPPSQLKDLVFQLQLWRNARGDITDLRRFADANAKVGVSQTLMSYSDPCACEISRIDHIVATNQPLSEAALVFSRDPEGNLMALQEGAESLLITRDLAGQLTGISRNGMPAENYQYDTNGNRTASHRHASYATAPANRLTQAGDWVLAYDHEGNLLTKSNAFTGARFAFTWDHRNRLTRVEREDPALPAPTLTDYRYDALNRRIAVIQDGQILWTYYDGVQPLVDFVDQETTPWQIQFAGEKLDELHAIWRRGKGVLWVLADQIGTPRRLLDTNGVPIVSSVYDSYGNLLTVSGTQPGAAGRFGFAGREWDENAALYYNRARYYDPELGRFIQEDPLGFQAGDANLYRYVGNQPMMFTDPTGLVTAVEYASLAVATARPANFCRFAVCVNGLWSGVANSVINLVPSGPPNATCAAHLVGVPTSTLGAGLSLGGQSAGAAKRAFDALQGNPAAPANPFLGNLIGMGACAYEAGLGF